MMQKQLLQGLKLEYGCVPYSDVNKRLLDAYARDSRYKILTSGIVVAVDFSQ
jgi:hypothetical protein